MGVSMEKMCWVINIHSFFWPQYFVCTTIQCTLIHTISIVCHTHKEKWVFHGFVWKHFNKMCLSEYFEVFECIYAPVIVVLVIIELQMKLKNVPLEKSKAKTLLKKRLNEDSCRVASCRVTCLLWNDIIPHFNSSNVKGIQT